MVDQTPTTNCPPIHPTQNPPTTINSNILQTNTESSIQIPCPANPFDHRQALLSDPFATHQNAPLSEPKNEPNYKIYITLPQPITFSQHYLKT